MKSKSKNLSKNSTKNLAYICLLLLVGTVGMTYANSEVDTTDEKVVITSDVMIDALNKDLAEEWASFIQYKKHDWEGKAEIQNLINDNFFRNLANDELEHIDKLGQRISDIGGVPTKKPSVIVEGGDVKKMIQDDLAKENSIILQIKEHITLATNLGDTDTKKMLEKILSDEEKQKIKMEDVLGINN